MVSSYYAWLVFVLSIDLPDVAAGKKSSAVSRWRIRQEFPRELSCRQSVVKSNGEESKGERILSVRPFDDSFFDGVRVRGRRNERVV